MAGTQSKASSPVFPENWQAQAMEELEKIRKANPTKAIFGVTLPKAWRSELAPFVRGGEVQKLLGVKAVAFEGTIITTFGDPKERKEEKKEVKPAKK